MKDGQMVGLFDSGSLVQFDCMFGSGCFMESCEMNVDC